MRNKNNDFREIKRSIVQPDFCDELGHMNIQYYYHILSDGMFKVMDLIGLPKKDIPKRRTSFVLYREEAEFRAELKEGDKFSMSTALEKIGDKSITFHHCFFSEKDTQLIFKSKFISVLMNLDTRMGISIPETVKKRILTEFPMYNSKSLTD